MKFFEKLYSRREFLKKLYLALLGLGMCFFLLDRFSRRNISTSSRKAIDLKEAMFYKKLSGNTVQCQLCFRNCIVSKGSRGFCKNRENLSGKLYSMVYAKPSAIHVDPIEKEPALHMLPGTNILCFGTAGCNFTCKFCHNWHLSQRSIEEMNYTDISPEAAVELAIKKKTPTISFTYNEPLSFYEYVYDTAKLAKDRGLKILWHSNGSINPEPLEELLRYTDSVTIDLKGFTDKFYQDSSNAKLDPVLQTIKTIRRKGKWLELVNLHIPTLNDNPGDVERMCSWIKDNVGSETPLHFSRFSPSYKLTNLYPTPISTLERAYRIAKESGLDYVTIGNLPGHNNNSTFCPKCEKRIIHRMHFMVLANHVEKGRCKFCGKDIPGIWS
ncbi:AmmeMemoRadiSam system radical SAM enzyme [Thermoproteota archaeon]